MVTLEVARIMHVDRIVPRYRPHGPAYQVGAAIRIVYQTGSAVEGADVRVELTYPGGEEFVLTRPTGPHGVALVVRFATESGTYTFTVTDVAHPVAEYDPSQNAETSDSVTIP